MDQNHDLAFARSAQLEGERQTVPRAELAAVIDAMRTLPQAIQLEAVVDASYVVKNGRYIARMLDGILEVSKEHAKGVIATIDQIFGCNGDLWANFAQLYVERRAPMTFKWVKSHQTARMVVHGTSSTRDLHGNILADAFADKAAERAQLPEDITDAYFSATSIAYHIRKRFIAVHMSINRYEQKNGKQDIVRDYKEKREPKPKISQEYADDVLRQFGHDPCFFHSKGSTCFQCRLCRRTSTINKLGEFAKVGQCIPAAPVQPTYVEIADQILRDNGGEEAGMDLQQAYRLAMQQPSMPPALASQPPMVGKTRVHESHHIHHFRGVFICSQCGFYVTKAARRLARPCGPSTTGSRAFLARFEAGTFPRIGE